jgi:DNA-binding transcriptional MerR regulator
MSETIEPAGAAPSTEKDVSPNKGVTNPFQEEPTRQAAGKQVEAAPPAEKPAEAAAESLIGGAMEPVEYTTFSVPEGMQVDTDSLAKFIPVAQELGLSQEGAQRLVTMYAEQLQAQAAQMQEAQTKQQAEIQETQKAWLKEISEDADLPKDKGVLKYTISRGIQKFCKTNGEFKQFTEVMEASGLGNHPAFVRLLYRVGRASSEEPLVANSQQASQAPKSLWQRLIPPPEPGVGSP